MAVQNAEHGQYFRSQLDELIQAHEKVSAFRYNAYDHDPEA